MRSWDLAVAIDRSAAAPVVAQIAHAIAGHISAGRLRPGERLPGTRDLARIVRVHRNTVVAAYAELATEGWIETSAGRGSFVAQAMPAALRGRAAPRRPGAPRVARYPLEPAPGQIAVRRGPGVLDLSGGEPDLRLVPVGALARAYRRALRRAGVLEYADPTGDERLRAALGAMLRSTRGLDPDPASLLVTRGSQHGLTLVARALVRPGDVVAVEELGYRSAWEAFRAAGARLAPLPLDDGGVRVEALEALARRERVRAVYLTPQHQYPTTVTLPAPRRVALLRLAAAERIAIVEDDYDGDFHYDARPVLPLASDDRDGAVVYVGTLSKIVAPGLRVGYVHAPPDVIRCLAGHRRYVDGQGDRAMEAALAELLEDGEIQQHVWRMRRAYAARREVLVAALRRELGDALRFTVPGGGMAVWCHAAAGIDVDAWARAAPERGVAFHPARDFALDGRSRPALRLGFARLRESELEDAVRRLAEARPAPARRA